MRVCFITPPSLFLLDERVFMSLGILKVAAVAEQKGYAVEHLDLNGVENYTDAVVEHAARTEARVFALTATTPQIPAAARIVRALRGALPKAKIILGGPHVTLVVAAIKKNPRNERALRALWQLQQSFDILVAGDGEDAFDLAVEHCRGNIRALIDADDPKSSLFLTTKRLSELPLPARHLIDADSYHYTIDGVRVLSLIAQLGCPFGCGFCGGRDSAMLRRVRMRPTALVLDEMRHLYQQYGVHGFMFHDDELNVNRGVVELMQGIVKLQSELGVEFRCRGFVKAELFTMEQAEWMFKAGFRRLLCGFESGSPRVLRNIQKKATITQNTMAVEIARSAGLEMKALMSIGHPGENASTIADTREWLLAIEPSDFDVTIITPYPGSPYYDEAQPVTDDEHTVWHYSIFGDSLYSYEIDYSTVADYYKGALGEYKSYVFTDYLAADELVEMRDDMEHRVRRALDIPYYSGVASTRFETSMGQLPRNILRTNP